MFQTSVGIDVRQDKFNVVALKTTINRILPVAHTTFSFDRRLSADDKVRIIADVVGQFIRQHHMMAADFFVAVPREHVIIREIRLPLSVKENLRTTLTYEMSKYIPLQVGDIYFDFQIVEESRQENTLRILLFAARKRDIDVYLNLAAHLGQKLSGIEIQATALGAFLTMYPQSTGNPRCGVIRSETIGGELCLYNGGLLEFSQWIETSTSDGDLAAHLLAAVQALQGRRNGDVRWLYCGIEQANAVPAPFKESAPLNIVPVDVAPAALPDPDWAPAYALAARGLRKFTAGINLLPPELKKKPNRRAYYMMLALIILSLVLLASWGAGHLIRHRMATAQLDSELQHLRPQVAEVEELISGNSRMEKQIARITALQKTRMSVLLALEELSSLIPATAWLEHLAFQTDGVRITGYADSAGDLVTILEASPLFKDVVFLSAITRSRDGKERFLIGMGFEKPKSGTGKSE